MRRNEGKGARALTAIRRWHVIAVAALAGAAVVAGAFDPGFDARWLTALVALAVLAVTTRDALMRVRLASVETLPDRPLLEIEGPLLWTVGAWVLTRLGGAYQAHLGLLPAGLLAWLVATRAPRIFIFPAVSGLALEVGLTAAGRQDGAALLLHLVLYTAAAIGLSQFARSEAYRARVREAQEKAKSEKDHQERARDFGLLTAQAPAVTDLPGLAEDAATARFNRLTLDYVDEALDLQLELLRHALGASTAAVLWSGREGEHLRIRGLSTARKDIERGPYSIGQGITGSVRDEVREVAIAPVKSGFAGLPYYRESVGVGAAYAGAIPVELSGDAHGRPIGILCVDRENDAPWTVAERQVLRLAARKIGLAVDAGRHLKAIDNERQIVRQFCAGLRELNQVLGLEPVAKAAVAAVKALIRADLVAISVVRGELHEVVRIEGLGADRLSGLRFAPEEGIVGQAVRIGHVLPAGGVYRGGRPIFTADDHFPELNSLLVLPLRKEGGPPIGALTVASRQADVFGKGQCLLLDLIAAQVAIKLDLAQAHEQIRELATTDGLTGLANHRALQQSFDNMLNRVRRQHASGGSGRMCFILTDIDKFKVLNDNHGHPFGDQVLQGVARVLDGAVRKVDLAARYGGEEFALLLEDSDDEGGRQMAERIRGEVEALEFNHPQNGKVKLTLSLGIASYPHDGTLKPELIEHADQALYYAKRAGRNRVTAWADMGSPRSLAASG